MAGEHHVQVDAMPSAVGESRSMAWADGSLLSLALFEVSRCLLVDAGDHGTVLARFAIRSIFL